MGEKPAETGEAEEAVRRNLLHGAESSVSLAQRILQSPVTHEYHVELAVVIEICNICNQTESVCVDVRQLRQFLGEMTGAIIYPGFKRRVFAAAWAAKRHTSEDEVWRRVSVKITHGTGVVNAIDRRIKSLSSGESAVSVIQEDNSRRAHHDEVDLAVFVQVAWDDERRGERWQRQHLACGKPAFAVAEKNLHVIRSIRLERRHGEIEFPVVIEIPHTDPVGRVGHQNRPHRERAIALID